MQWRGATGLLLAAWLPSAAQALPEAFLVKDINRVPIVFSSNPRQLTRAGARAFFVADTPNGMELWRTDGSAAGTARVKTVDVIGNLTAVGDAVVFVAGDDVHGPELWTSDGTPAGTLLLRDIRPGPEGAFDFDERSNTVTSVGGTVLFLADDGVHGSQLWRSIDGTAAGTMPVDEIDADEIPAAGGVLLYSGRDRAHGMELWRSDGTAQGTFLVKDIHRGPGDSDPRPLAYVGAILFFSAADAEHGVELWKSDGTEAGTQLVRDLRPGSADAFPFEATAVNGALFFRADAFGDGLSQLWKTDGTAEGTELVRRFAPVGFNGFGGAVDLGGTLVFVQADREHGVELWASDGTETGTALLRDINPGTAHSWPAGLTVVNGVVLFMADDGAHGAELWRSDGTADGTLPVRDINPGPAKSASDSSNTALALNGALILAADDGAHGVELWRSDGSPDGTVLVKDVWPGPATQASSPASLTALGDTLFFTADDGAARQLWKSDGSEAGTVRVADLVDIDAGRAPMSDAPLAILGGRLFFGADDGVAGNELWASDGTAAGTVLVSDIRAGPDGSFPAQLTPAGDAVFFTADDGTGRGLWKSDGTGAGTVRVFDALSNLRLISVGERLYFILGSGRDDQLWVTDDSPRGTIKLADAFFIYYAADLDGTLYFTQSTTLWKSDGSVAGTVRVADFHPVSGQYVPNHLTAAGGRLFFAAKSPGGSDVSLWALGDDGIRQLRGLDQFSPFFLTAAAGRVFFVVRDATYGEEVWSSDGLADGTRVVRDINPGPDGSNPSALSGGAGPLRFRACDADGCRLWESDGTDAGTRPFADLGARLSSGIVSAGDLAFFSAGESTHGVELWAAPLSAAACVGDCDGDGGVTIAELVRLVGAALGQPSVACAIDADVPITIDRLVRAVANALVGCRGFPSTPTPTESSPASPTTTDTPARPKDLHAQVGPAVPAGARAGF